MGVLPYVGASAKLGTRAAVKASGRFGGAAAESAGASSSRVAGLVSDLEKSSRSGFHED